MQPRVRVSARYLAPAMQGKDEIAAAYDYWVHSHRKVDFTYKDTSEGDYLAHPDAEHILMTSLLMNISQQSADPGLT